jgi:hypothetical protein
MSPAKWVLGCSVFLIALSGLIVSSHLVDAVIPIKRSREATATAQSNLPSDISVTGERPNSAGPEGSVLAPRICVDLNGRSFGWNWPNVPFGSTACSYTGPKAAH